MGPGGGEPLLQPLAHPLDQVLQHADLAGQLIGAARNVALDALEQGAKLAAHRLDLVGEDLVRLAYVLDLAAQAAGVDGAHDDRLQREGQGHDANQGGHTRAPSPTASPEKQGCCQCQAEVGADQERPGDLAHRPAYPNQMIIGRKTRSSRRK